MKIGIVGSLMDPAAVNMARHIVDEYGFNDAEPMAGADESFISGDVSLHMINMEAWKYAGADGLGCDLLVFVSKHRSAKGIPALTTHSLGNWNDRNDLGGEPHKLSAAAPVEMLGTLRRLSGVDVAVAKVYEATHHGPLLNTPSLFVELGGSDEMIGNVELAHKIGKVTYGAVLSALDGVEAYDKRVIGIGSNHYPEKFSRMALERGYAFSYIFPKYAMLNADGSDNQGMIGKAVEMTKGIDLAVIEWKSLNAPMREMALGVLNELGVDHERV